MSAPTHHAPPQIGEPDARAFWHGLIVGGCISVALWSVIIGAVGAWAGWWS